MTQITASLVKELRDATGVGMMECKNVLIEAKGDKELAHKLLRERGAAVAGKKASRAANEGLVSAAVSADGQTATIIEVNCETDFVARNEGFQSFVAQLTQQALGVADGELAAQTTDQLTAKIQEIGENLKVGRNFRFQLQGAGLLATYIHLGGKVGVLLEVGCGKAESASTEVLRDAAKDVTLHIAACNPQCLSRDQVDPALVVQEKEIYAKQVEGKPANIIDKIVAGKLEKFYSQICLQEQGFVKDPDQSVTQYLAARGKEVGDSFTIRRFVRVQIGG